MSGEGLGSSMMEAIWVRYFSLLKVLPSSHVWLLQRLCLSQTSNTKLVPELLKVSKLIDR